MRILLACPSSLSGSACPTFRQKALIDIFFLGCVLPAGSWIEYMGMIRLESDFQIVCHKNPRARYYAWDVKYEPYSFVVDGFQHGKS